MASIIPLTQVQPDMIEALLDRTFGPDRFARTAYRIREGTDWLEALSFAALDDDEMLVGTIQVWPVALTDSDGRPYPMLMIGPVAVLPEQQGDGFGKAMMLATLEAIGDNDALPQMLIGDPDYYDRFFGFSASHTQGWHCPGPNDPARLLVRTSNPAILPAEGMLGPWTAETQAAARDAR